MQLSKIMIKIMKIAIINNNNNYNRDKIFRLCTK